MNYRSLGFSIVGQVHKSESLLPTVCSPTTFVTRQRALKVEFVVILSHQQSNTVAI